ncbi:MAG: DUF3990 domain-containing protein [Bacteroidaceae bacterium]|nr:DUF3990 domain-containing protein [Bacteroidaceae bacterium]
MKLYHGSNMSIVDIDLSKGRCGKDFGQGFYLSADEAQARQMAEITTFKLSSGSPTVTAFEIDDAVLYSGELRVKVFEGYSEEWAEFVLMNRKNASHTPMHDYDIVIGPIADDKVGVQMRLFTENYINLAELVKRLTYIRPTIQYFFATPAAIKHLHRV